MRLDEKQLTAAFLDIPPYNPLSDRPVRRGVRGCARRLPAIARSVPQAWLLDEVSSQGDRNS
jgi:hypothetical protein